MTDFLSPMLVSEIPGHRNRIKSAGHVFVQPKLAGWCCMANTRTRRIYTRTGHEIHTLPHINAALPVYGPEWLHGELYVHGFELDGADQGMIKRGDERVEFHVFDCVSDKGFGDRFFYYPIQTYFDDPIRYVQAFCIPPDEIHDYYRSYLKKGYEGIIIRLDGHGYEHGRSINVFKIKPGTEVI